MEENHSINGLSNKLEELEKKLQLLEAQRNSIVDNIPFLAWVKDLEGRYLYVNQPYLDSFKLSFENVIGKTVFDFFSYEDAQQYEQEDRKVIEQKRTINFQTKRGNEWFSTVKSPMFGPDNEIIGTTGFERNITDNIETLNSLRKERDLLHALMENIPDAIYFKDIKSRFLRINKAKAHEFGLQDPHDAIGKSDFDFYEKDKAGLNFKDEELILNTGTQLISKEERITKAGEEEIWISTTKSPIRDDKSNIVGLQAGLPAASPCRSPNF
jgi:PAS domain S-box-containing protein